jgi:hypothetical protein
MIHSGTPGDVPPDADCAIRKFAYEYGQHLRPDKTKFSNLFDALQLGACGMEAPSTPDTWVAPHTSLPTGTLVYVDMSYGVDSTASVNSTKSSFATLSAAVDASRLINGPVSIVLRGGTHTLDSTINLGPADSGLRIQNYPGEYAVVSGGKKLTTSWTASTACKGCFEADLRSQVDTVTGLRKDDVREIRARYPNFDPEKGSVIDGEMHVHDGKDGWIQSKSAWVATGENMNGIKGPWPPTEEAKTYVMGAVDWPGVEWPMCIETDGKCNPDSWTGEGDWGEVRI